MNKSSQYTTFTPQHLVSVGLALTGQPPRSSHRGLVAAISVSKQRTILIIGFAGQHVFRCIVEDSPGKSATYLDPKPVRYVDGHCSPHVCRFACLTVTLP